MRLPSRKGVWISGLAICLVGCLADHSNTPLAGGDGTETGNARIQGRLVDESGTPVYQALVTAYPTDHNPYSRAPIPAEQKAVSDKNGVYRFDSIPLGIWNVEARDPSRRLVHLSTGVELGETRVELGDEILQSPGQLVVDLVDSLAFLPGSYLHVAGTSSFSGIDSQDLAEKMAVLYDVPPGTLPQVILSAPVGNDSMVSMVLADSVFLPESGQKRITPYQSWIHKLRFNLLGGADGISLTEGLRNFVIPLRLTTENFEFDAALPDGSDLRATNAADISLPITIEQFDPIARKGLVWVRVDSVQPNNSSQYVTLHYGKPDASPVKQYPFANEQGYAGVWFLSQDADGKSSDGLYWDATQSGSDGNDRVQNTGRNGILGFGKSLSAGDYIQVPALKPSLQSLSSFTLQAWIRSIGTGPVGGEIVNIGDNFGLRLTKNGELHSFIWPSNSADTSDYPWHKIEHPGRNLIDSAWHFVASTYDGDSLRLYIDGHFVESGAAPGPIGYSQALNVTMGIHANKKQGFEFSGDLDEIEIHSVRRSAEWIRASYESQRQDGVFLKAVKQ